MSQYREARRLKSRTVAGMLFLACVAHGSVACAQVANAARLGAIASASESRRGYALQTERILADTQVDEQSPLATLNRGTASPHVRGTGTEGNPETFTQPGDIDGPRHVLVGALLGAAVGVFVTLHSVSECEADNTYPGEKGMCGLAIPIMGPVAVGAGTLGGGILGWLIAEARRGPLSDFARK